MLTDTSDSSSYQLHRPELWGQWCLLAQVSGGESGCHGLKPHWNFSETLRKCPRYILVHPRGRELGRVTQGSVWSRMNIEIFNNWVEVLWVMPGHDFLILFCLPWLTSTSTNAQNRELGLVACSCTNSPYCVGLLGIRTLADFFPYSLKDFPPSGNLHWPPIYHLTLSLSSFRIPKSLSIPLGYNCRVSHPL